MNEFSHVIRLCLLLGLAFSTVLAEDAGEAEDGEAEEDPYKEYWIAHGVCASLAWAILVPLAICSAVLRRQFLHAGFSEGAWFQAHRALNLLAAILTIIAFSLAVHVIRQEDGKSNWTENTHFTVGLVIFLATLVQATLAFFRPKHHTEDEPEQDKDEKAVASEEQPVHGEDTVEHTNAGATTSTSGGPPVAKVRLIRRIWEHKHRYFGYGLLATAWWQIQDGWELYYEEIGGKDLGNVFLAAAAGICGMGVIIYSVHKAGEIYGAQD